jgi:UDP-N-acetylglucosamine diphosphorylase/glucosamine-1-phosphate N-acetyltransferase
MSNIILVDRESWLNLHPLTFTRSVADVRLGIYTIREKWEKRVLEKISVSTTQYLQKKYGDFSQEGFYVNSAVLPDDSLVQEIKSLKEGEDLYKGEVWIASCGYFSKIGEGNARQLATDLDLKILNYPEDIFIHVGAEIVKDIELNIDPEHNGKLSSTNTIIGDNEVIIGKGAWVECSTFNTFGGPIYIGKNAVIMEGSHIRGPFAIGESSIAKMGTRIYENTSIGPGCRVGGEIKNSVIMANSNKSHDGYMGNAVIGEWCNWGADTNNSNMKNNYGEVGLWNYRTQSFRKTDRQFLGVIMGDHSKTSINTMFNTATVVGVSCNIFGSGFPRKYIPSFSWGGAHGFSTYRIDKVCKTAEAMMERRNETLTENDKAILSHIYNITSSYRRWE